MIWNIFTFLTLLVAHKGIDHGPAKHTDIKLSAEKNYEKINQIYLSEIKPLFQRACFDCHSNRTKFPWYYSLPGVKTLLDKDIIGAQKHIDFSGDFPFESHSTPTNDLTAVLIAVKEKTMPPFRYQVLHRDSILSDTDIRKIENWVTKAKRLLE